MQVPFRRRRRARHGHVVVTVDVEGIGEVLESVSFDQKPADLVVEVYTLPSLRIPTSRQPVGGCGTP